MSVELLAPLSSTGNSTFISPLSSFVSMRRKQVSNLHAPLKG